MNAVTGAVTDTDPLPTQGYLLTTDPADYDDDTTIHGIAGSVEAAVALAKSMPAYAPEPA